MSIATITTIAVSVVIGLMVMSAVRKRTDHGGVILVSLFTVAAMGGIATVAIDTILHMVI